MTSIDIFLTSGSSFDEVALAVYAYQYAQQPIYRHYCDLLGRSPSRVQSVLDIPFLPVGFFKSHPIIATGLEAQYTLESSTTSGGIPSRHLVADMAIYRESYMRTFEQCYGSPDQYVILALLPSYLERGTSSLLYMVNDLIQRSGSSMSAFFANDFAALAATIARVPADKKLLLIGVTYALLDFAEQYELQLAHAIIMETGGMKGRRVEMTRAVVHQILTSRLGVVAIQSEYGMTELLSQAYSQGNGLYTCPPWMRMMTRDMTDPLAWINTGRVGALSIIDLANIHSCSFVAVQDMGIVYPDGTFEVTGRLDQSEIRGCNLLYTG
jgi:hypothetical protein